MRLLETRVCTNLSNVHISENEDGTESRISVSVSEMRDAKKGDNVFAVVVHEKEKPEVCLMLGYEALRLLTSTLSSYQESKRNFDQ